VRSFGKGELESSILSYRTSGINKLIFENFHLDTIDVGNVANQ
jgi:hypothetical protein